MSQKKQVQCEATRYNLKLHNSKNTKSPLINKDLLYICTPPFFDELLKGNHNWSSKGDGGGDRLRLSKFARKDRSSSSMSTKSWPWAAWTVMTVSNIRRMLESSEVNDGGIAAAVRSMDALVEVSSIEKGRGGAAPEDWTRATFRACSHLRRPLPKKGGTYKSYYMNRLRCRKVL